LQGLRGTGRCLRASTGFRTGPLQGLRHEIAGSPGAPEGPAQGLRHGPLAVWVSEGPVQGLGRGAAGIPGASGVRRPSAGTAVRGSRERRTPRIASVHM
jgi:hypothetical protein